MKTQILMLAAILLFGFSASGQSTKNVPDVVKSTFTQKFSGATHVKWGMENEKEWESEFQMNGKAYSANFDNTGTWLETEYKIAVSEIPQAVKSTLDKEASGMRISASEVTETKDGKAFEFVVGKGDKKTELIIDQSGKLVKKEQVKEEEEKDEKDEKN